MSEKSNEQDANGNSIQVTVVFVPTSKSKLFTVPKTETLQELLDQAYIAFNESKQPNDAYFCKSGENLSGDLSKTIEAVVSSRCKEGIIEIRRPTGGA